MKDTKTKVTDEDWRILKHKIQVFHDHVKGLKKKTGQVYAGLTSLLTISLKAVINEEPSLRRVSQCWS